MGSPASGGLRLIRGSVLGLIAVTLALTGHVAAGGAPPSPSVTAGVLFVSVWASILLAGRRLGRLALVAILGVSQYAMHHAFTLGAGPMTCLPTGHAGHLPSATACPVDLDQAVAMAHAGGTGMAMSLAHAAAALALGLVLARGEALLWFLATLIWPRPPVVPALARPRILLLTVVAQRSGALVQWRPGGVGRRGPPGALLSTPV